MHTGSVPSRDRVFVVTGTSADGEDVYLKDIWPTREEIHQLESKSVIPAIFADVYSKITKGPSPCSSLFVIRDDSQFSIILPRMDVFSFLFTLISSSTGSQPNKR